jgi:signal transduction histidine kinase
MAELTQRLLTEARSATTIDEYWRRAAAALREWSGSAQVHVTYSGPTAQDAGTAEDGASSESGGAAVIRTWSDATGRRVQASFQGSTTLPGTEALDAAIDTAAQLALMVGRRTSLERDRRLGGFVVELSRWLLAAPERDLMLRYTLQSVMKLFDCGAAYAALHEPAAGGLRIVTALGLAADLQGSLLPLEQSTTGRVVRTGEALITDNIREEPDVYLSADPTGFARAAMITPLHTSAGILGAMGIVRYRRAGDPAAPQLQGFSLNDLHFFTAVAAHVAGGLELSNAVAVARAAADRAAAMVHASPLPLMLVDGEGRAHLINEAARRVFGLQSVAAAVGRTLDQLGFASSEMDLVKLLAQPRRTNAPWHGRVVVTQPGFDRRVCDCTVTDLQGLGSTDLLVALYDRTDELRAQRELIAREKLATVGEIASGVAHEVNNPLAAIRMEAEMLGKATHDADTEAVTKTIVREVDRAARIVRSLLRLARRADTTPTSVHLNDLVRDVAEIRQRVLRADGVDVRTDIDTNVAPVLGLGQELMQVVINLVTNAEHAVRGRDPAVIRVVTQGRDGWARLIVEDSGTGVPAEVRHRVFDPFFTTKAPDEGSGLGLAICHRIVSELGGRIWLEDSPLGGARFLVDLPTALAGLDLEPTKIG